MIAIANCSDNWAIGRNGQLICKIPEDMQRFHDLTMGKTVIMGHNTLRSLPGGLPLPGRHNIVLFGKHSAIESHTVNAPLPPGTSLSLTHSIDRVLWLTEGLPSDDVFVIGGERVFKELLPYCDKCLLTMNSEDSDGADAFFPNLEGDPEWKITHRSDVKCHDGIMYEFVDMERIKG